MKTIARELTKRSVNVKEVQRKTNTTRVIGAASAGLGIAVGLAAAFLGSERAVLMTLGGCAIAIGGGSVVKANLEKAKKEKTNMETVEELGKEFMAIVSQLKDDVEAIKTVSEEFEKKSSSLKTTTEQQTKRFLSETKRLEKLLNQTAALAERSRQVMDVAFYMERGVGEMLNIVTQITSTPEEDAELRECIAGSAECCEKTLTELANMRKVLKDFEEMLPE